MNKFKKTVLMLCLILSGALCYASGVAGKMKALRIVFAIAWALVSCLTSVQAQESAFEVLLPYHCETTMTYCRETTDGGFLLNAVTRNTLLKLDGEGSVVNEVIYEIDESGVAETRFVAFFEDPQDPSRHVAVAQLMDWDTEIGNLFHIVYFDNDLLYDPSEVLVVDFSENVKRIASGYPDRPYFSIEEDGCISFAGMSYDWNETKRLMYARVWPNGETALGVCDQFNKPHELVMYFAPKDDHYEMLALSQYNPQPNAVQLFLNYYEVSHDFEQTDSIFCLVHPSFAKTPLYYMEYEGNYSNDSCYVARVLGSNSSVVPIQLSDSVMVIPTKLTFYRYYHANQATMPGAALWKLDQNFNMLGHAFFDPLNGQENSEELWAVNPVLFNGEYLYFCYTTYKQALTRPMQTVICKLDTDLNVIWKRWYGGKTESYRIMDFALTSDGGCIASGTGNVSPSQYAIEGFPYVLKVNADGYCSMEEQGEPLLKPYCFFPNPVEDRLHMEFSPDVTPRQVELYDLQGRLVGVQNNGFESVEMSQLPSGTYTLHIVMEDGTSYSDKLVKH